MRLCAQAKVYTRMTGRKPYEVVMYVGKYYGYEHELGCLPEWRRKLDEWRLAQRPGKLTIWVSRASARMNGVCEPESGTLQ